MTPHDQSQAQIALRLLTGRSNGPKPTAAYLDAWFEARAWATHPDIRGFGIHGNRRGRAAVAVYADPRGNGAARIPDSIRLVRRGEKVPVVVAPLGLPRLQEGSPATFVRPCPGCAVALEDTSYGTFGCLVRDPVANGATYLLTAAHVIAKSGLAQGGESVFQPRQPRQIGALSCWGKIAFTEDGFPNLFDAALATVDTGAVTPTVHAVNRRPLGAASLISQGMRVQKCGAASGHSSAKVINTNFSCWFEYRLADGSARRAGFQRQILCERFTERGDSGAAVLNDDFKVVGLVIGATSEGTVFSPIGPVLTRFGVAIA